MTLGRRRVALICSGSARHLHDRLRSVPLLQFAPLLSLPGHDFVLVQHTIRDADRAVRETFPRLRFPGAALGDLADGAALLSHCDLVVTVDTAAAHIAGALGLPTWLLLPYSPDHRWLLERSDSPWYPTMKLYRQPRPGAWEAAIDAMRRDLTRL